LMRCSTLLRFGSRLLFSVMIHLHLLGCQYGAWTSASVGGAGT
jgi:hypothetical protein